MGILDFAKEDMQAITSDKNGFGVDITLISPSNISKSFVGLSTSHHLKVDQMTGEVVSSRTASISFSEVIATTAGYTVRDVTTGEVSLKNHRVETKDSTGIVKKYIIDKFFADEKLGLIVCILGDYE